MLGTYHTFFISSFMFIFFDPDTEGFIRTRSVGGEKGGGGHGEPAVGEKSVMC